MTVKAAIKEEIKSYNKAAREYFSNSPIMKLSDEISNWSELRGRRETLISLVYSLSDTLGFTVEESKRTRYTKLILLRIVKTEEEER